MRSRVLTLKDPRTVDLSGHLEPFALDRERLDRELRRSTNPYIRWEKGTVVSAGDLVVCRLGSDCPRFRKERVKFTAGSGMFHRELEVLTLGMAVGETRETDLPEGHVALTVTEVTNRIVPEISDALVAQMGLEGIHTVAEYTAYLTKQQKEERFREGVYAPYRYLIDQVVGGSEFVIDEADWQKVVDLRLDRSRTLSRQQGMVLEEMTPEQFAGRIPVQSYHELVALEQKTAWETLYMNLLGRRFARETGFQPSQARYREMLRDYVAAWGGSEETAREVEPYESYEFFSYNSLASELFQEIIKKAFFKEDN